MNDQLIEALSSFQKNNEKFAQAINSYAEQVTKNHQIIVKDFENSNKILDITKIPLLPKNLGKAKLICDPTKNS